MKNTLHILKKYNVSEYELIGWLTSVLEDEVYDGCPETRNERLLDELNKLSWRV